MLVLQGKLEGSSGASWMWWNATEVAQGRWHDLRNFVHKLRGGSLQHMPMRMVTTTKVAVTWRMASHEVEPLRIIVCLC